MENKIRLGIDFGTTYCCVGVWKDGGVVIIPNEIGERTTPSVVIFDSPNEVYVGEETLNHLSKKDSVKIYEIKRLIGKKYYQIEELTRYFPFVIEQEENGDPVIKITFDNGDTIEYTPEDIATLIINKLIQNAESYLNEKVNEVIITVPADFTDIQRNRIKFAAETIQGIKVLQIINEPCAAVLSYGFPINLLKNVFFPFNQNFSLVMNNNPKISHPMEEMNNNTSDSNNPFKFSLQTGFMNLKKDKKVLVFDFGGGTFDLSIIDVTDFQFETRANKGDQFLGGGDLDNKLMEYCIDDFSKKNQISKDEIENNNKCLQRLKIACEQTKKILSVKFEDRIYLEDFYQELPINCTITRAKFEELCKEFFEKLIPPINDVLNYAKIKNTDIDEIILVGGSSKIPKIKEILKEKFPGVIINDQISPDEVVAFGATIYCESLRRNTGEFWKDFEYLDATQHSYGIEVDEGQYEVILPKGSKYPTSFSKYFFNYYNDQETFDIRVFQGENEYANENVLINEFTIINIPQKPKGELCIKITFSIDKSQILNVNAFIAEGNINENVSIIRNDISLLNGNSILDNINSVGNGLNKYEKKFKLEIYEYCQNFREMKDDKDKYNIIKNYNKVLNDYLKFLEENGDVESEKYLFLLGKLFKSYSYFFKTQLIAMVDIMEKINIQKNVENYLGKIVTKNPFRLRYLLGIFNGIRKENSEIYYSSSIYSMELLEKKANEYFNKKQKNFIQNAKSIYEEILIIAKDCIKDNITLNSINIDLKRRYKEVKEKCEIKIKIISADSFSEIEKTKTRGNLFTNDNNLDNDNLRLLCFNFNQSLKKLKEIGDLNDNYDALESKAICLANIVKIEFSIVKRTLSLEKLLSLAEESINIANKLGDICNNKNWYQEINILKSKIEEKIYNSIPAPPIQDMEKLRKELEEKFECGNEEFLRFLLTNYPYEGCIFSENMIQEYLNDKRKFLKKLRMNYRNSSNISLDSSPNNNESSSKTEIILEYINNMMNRID